MPASANAVTTDVAVSIEDGRRNDRRPRGFAAGASPAVMIERVYTKGTNDES
jgi:hypothetical protein